MKAFLSFLTLSFLPKSHDFGLLLLRVALGGGMMALHGWNKVQLLFGLGGWSNSKQQHAAKLKEVARSVDVFHLGGNWSLYALVFAEVTCSALLIIGFGTRFAALVLSFAMGVAFFVKNQHAIFDLNGELSALYLAGFLVILVTGPGKFAFDGGGPVGAKD